MIGEHSPNTKPQKAGKSFEIYAGFLCEIEANLYLSSLLHFHTGKYSCDFPTKYLYYLRGELAKGFILQQYCALCSTL